MTGASTDVSTPAYSGSAGVVDEKPVSTGRKRYRFGKTNKSEQVAVPADEKGSLKNDHVKPVGVFTLFRYATRTELLLNLVGLVLAAAAGAGQPLMTLFFGKITKAFTDYGTQTQLIDAGQRTEAALAALEAAKAKLKHDAGMLALWITVIGRFGRYNPR